MMTPLNVEEAQQLLLSSDESWDSERWMDPSTLLRRPILPLVRRFMALGEDGSKRLAWLCFYAARRALPAWTEYCDGDKPQRTLAALERLLEEGMRPDARSEFHQPAKPSASGVPIPDCRAADTACAAGAAARAFAFAMGGDELDAMECLSDADGAIEQSPLGAREDFRRWLAEVAVPCAVEGRSMTASEREAFRGTTGA